MDKTLGPLSTWKLFVDISHFYGKRLIALNIFLHEFLAPQSSIENFLKDFINNLKNYVYMFMCMCLWLCVCKYRALGGQKRALDLWGTVGTGGCE